MGKRDQVLAAFGRNLRTQRERKGLTQEQLGLEADITMRYIGMIERAETSATVGMLGKVAEADGDTATAISAYEQAGALLPQHHRPWLFLSQLYAHSGRADQQAKAADLRKRAEGLCRGGNVDAAVQRSLPHDFAMMGCAGLLGY